MFEYSEIGHLEAAVICCKLPVKSLHDTLAQTSGQLKLY
jgi:hypothetical protein